MRKLFAFICFLSMPVMAETVYIQMNSTKPSGHAWDAFGGAPEPYVRVNGRSYRSQHCQNSFSCTIVINEGGRRYKVEVLDADVNVDDSAGVAICRRGKRCYVRGAQVKIK